MKNKSEHCHVCGQEHRMLATPCPFVPAGQGLVFCPYDADGVATLVVEAMTFTDEGYSVTLIRQDEVKVK